MEKNVIIVIIFDIFVPTALIAYSAVVLTKYLFHQNAQITRQMWGTAVFGGIISLAYIALVTFPRTYDFYQYMRNGDEYTKTKVCSIRSVTGDIWTELVFGTKTIYCLDGTKLYISFNYKYERQSIKGAVFFVKYLPRSHLVLYMEPKSSHNT